MILETDTEKIKNYFNEEALSKIQKAFPNNKKDPKHTVKSWSSCCISRFTYNPIEEKNTCNSCGKECDTKLVLIPFNKVHKERVING
tara:strand:- start:220 stop:480 length:261 start_codon:yes stop_codon:yes gene_type:complete